MKKFILSLITAIALPLGMMAQDIETLLPKAQAGDAQAMIELAQLYRESWDDGSDANALKWYKKAAESGNAQAMFDLYEIYYFGNIGVDSNEEEACMWLERAVAKGHSEALYTQGNEVLYSDTKLGLSLITRGAEAGSANAQMFLGTYFNNSWNDEYNPAKAFEWMKKAAEQDLAEAQYNLATYYLKGIGTSANKSEALKWLKKSAENDYSFAIEILSWL